MPQPSRTCTFGASFKAAYYSLSACYLKNFLRALQALGLYIFVRDKRGQGLKTSTAHLYLTFPSVSPPGTSNDPSWMMVEKEQGMLANHKPELRNT